MLISWLKDADEGMLKPRANNGLGLVPGERRSNTLGLIEIRNKAHTVIQVNLTS